MRALLFRPRPAGGLIVVAAAAAVLALVRAAVAGDDLGIRRAEFWPEQLFGTVQPAVQAPVTEAPDAPVTTPRHRHARRIWAASRSRPLRITLDRKRHAPRFAVAARLTRPVRLGRLIRPTHPIHPTRPAHLARLKPAAEPQVVFPRMIILPKPPVPALVSIYEDRTLRNGDAVMMTDGIHVFNNAGSWPYRPKDFVRLPLAAALDWHLRQTLNDLDKNPPTRWTGIVTTSG